VSEHEYGDDSVEETPLVKTLRKQIEKLSKTNGDLTTEVSTLRSKTRAADIVALLPEGVNPKAAKFFPTDTDVTKEAVEAWLTENADLFPVPAAGGDGSEGDGGGEGSGPDGDARAALKRLNNMGSAGEQKPDVQSGKDQRMKELAAKQKDMTTDQFVAELNKIIAS